MSEMRFDGRVAIVTGAGNGLGRSYARLLAARGARVVVNDIGTSSMGKGYDEAPAHAVTREIIDAGGQAVADTHTVAEEDSARAIVQTALDAFGKLDILVNNAGISIMAPFGELSSADFMKVDQHQYDGRGVDVPGGVAAHAKGALRTDREYHLDLVSGPSDAHRLRRPRGRRLSGSPVPWGWKGPTTTSSATRFRRWPERVR